MPQDALRELLDLSAIHSFYIQVLEERLGHPVPPHEVKSENPAALSLTLYRWLSLLDLAISPVMVRDALQKRPQREALEALLRMYILKASTLDVDRDKADFLATYLYRNPPSWHRGGRPQDGETADHGFAADFEEELKVILSGAPVPEPPPEHRQLVRELDYIRQEVDDVRHFDQLTDLRVVQRVRELKASLRSSFYHFAILSRVASYNAYFGRRFDDLFRTAAGHIKGYAQQVQEKGGSILSRVEGDVIVKNLTEVEEEQILRQEYGRAQDHFREVAKMKKVVDNKHRAGAAAAAAGALPAGGLEADGLGAAPVRRIQAEVEEGKIRSVVESIQHFVRAAEPGATGVVPLRNINVGLSSAESDAFRTDFRGEKSFRADLAACLVRMVCLVARMQAEIIEYHAKAHSAYLWKPHADALQYLHQAAGTTLQTAAALSATAEQRGLKERVAALHASQQKLQKQMKQATHTLQVPR